MREMTVPARIDYLESIFNFVDMEMNRVGVSDKLQNNIRIAVEEIFVNITSYAYPEGAGEVTVRLPEEQDTFVVEFLDDGVPFDPLAKEEADITLPLEERGIGGLGILMVTKLMDGVEYQRVGHRNILTITKGNLEGS